MASFLRGFFFKLPFFGGFDGKSFLAFLTIWLVENLILIQAIAFKKALLFGGLVGLKREE
ncbi:hypothetical protein EWZ74_01835 [Helicobacter pylori]|nr:hypothetical protein [Helicobacter pylori]